MKYFTKELWISWQNDQTRDAGMVEYDKRWDAYRQTLAALRDRLSAEAWSFFTDGQVHDGELQVFKVIPDEGRNGSAERAYPVTVELEVQEERGIVWSLRYTSVRRVGFDYPSDEPLFLLEGDGLGDWGYHELTDAGDGMLRHEVLFSSGSTLSVEFAHLDVAKSPA